MSDKENCDLDDTPTGEMSDLDRLKIRKKYKDILDEFSREEANPGTQQEEGTIKDAMDRADSLFGQIDTPQEALLDARVFRHLSRMCRQYAESLTTSTVKFSAAEFAEKLADSAGAILNDETGSMNLGTKQWLEIGEESSKVFRRAPFISYIYGSVEKSDMEVEDVPQKERARRSTAHDKLADATKALILGQDEEEVEEGAETSGKKTLTEMLVQSTYQQLVREFKRNGKEPISYLRFVVNPESFGKTVENMFHVSFLVKEDKAQIDIDPAKNLPLIQPIKKSRTQATQSGDNSNKKQVVVNFSMSQWESLVKNLSIAKAQICHDEIMVE